ncbi:MAG: nucleotidyl transferase AbiEii/AbiGii toxin family protein [Mycobacteriales bacterium]
MTYTTSEAHRAALTARANRIAATTGNSAGDVLNSYYLQRLIARVFLADPTGWVLKGGQALLVRLPAARTTRDIDLYRRDTPDIDTAAQQLIDAASYDAGDFLTYTFVSRKDMIEGGRVARLNFEVRLGRRKVHRVGVDVVVDSRPLGSPSTQPLESLIPIDWPTTWPEVTLYPLEDHAADKIIAMYERHPGGRPSSRHRDLVDLVLIALYEPVNGAELQASLAGEVTHRRARGVGITLPNRFQLPSPEWEAGYAEHAVEPPPLVDYRTIDAARPLIDAFLNPVLAGDPLMTWQPSQQRWTTRF